MNPDLGGRTGLGSGVTRFVAMRGVTSDELLEVVLRILRYLQAAPVFVHSFWISDRVQFLGIRRQRYPRELQSFP